MDNENNNDKKGNRKSLEDLLDRLRKSGVEVTNVTRSGTAIGIVGGVRGGKSMQDQKQTTESKH